MACKRLKSKGTEGREEKVEVGGVKISRVTNDEQVFEMDHGLKCIYACLICFF
jgi:hypothetical protein